MELKGTVKLDDNSMEELRKSIREEIIDEIKNDAYSNSEVELLLSDLTYSQYYNFIKSTIETVVNSIETEATRSAIDLIKIKKLLAIKIILEI